MSSTVKTNTSGDEALQARLATLVSTTAPVAGILSGTVDVQSLTKIQRQGLLDGPKVNVYVGRDVAFRNAPVRAMMAWSSKANVYFNRNPLANRIVIQESAASIQAVQAILKATVTLYGMGGENIAPVHRATSFAEELRIYQAAHELGMKSRVEKAWKHLRHMISTNLLSYENLSLFLVCVPPTDDLFNHLAKDLATRRFQGRIPDTENFEKYLAENEALKNTMDEIDASHKAEREVRKAQADAEHAEMRRVATENKHYEREYRARVAALMEKIKTTNGGILSLSAEEAELKRELGI